MPPRKVLMIEDDQDQALAMGIHLRKAGYEVISAPDALAAIPVAKNAKPDIILLDLGLPGGGGLTVLARLRTLLDTAIIPVIVISASATDRDSIFAAGAQGYMEKPANPDEVIETIENVLGER